ncbi:LOW QUALITY PROTEIN: uroporphyrinogen decarboxylase 1, chloroplastic-like [Dioscorea cayenensis subsp. rotundata]|uniref:Uroporphyrinogen decarboxylase n=1 Tax=Dioscorea cayennensis subsp. rotundata TaxID=55577 RepID=A0AB40BGM6_DIOCR|nr:LOW QUALITY PROTEIN: uroporphyrinogen decarboxylase 1, chloroplastic-like [Dioscorea cayenensis subsp. rotundata]
MHTSTIPCGSSFLQVGFARENGSGLGRRFPPPRRKPLLPRASAASDPLLVQAARGNPVSRPPAWMMRQAGRYMAAYRKLAEKHPSFRERSETVDLIVEISLQPWRAFGPDGVIIFSDILTPLPAFGVPFEIEEVKGPIIQSPICSEEGLKALHPIDFEKLNFVGDSLKILRQEVGDSAAVLGFVGAPWTIATYIVEGGTTRTYTTIKRMCHTAPHVLRALLSHLTRAISEYIIFQIKSGAQCIQIFDSWGGQLPPTVWEQWSKPYIEEIVSAVKKKYPEIPLVLYINGNGGLLERMTGIGVDVIGLDWTVDMADGRRRLGSEISVQGNVDPAYLFSPLPVLTDEIHRVVRCAGRRGHILNLGHGVLVKTPEEAVAHFFDVVRGLRYDSLFAESLTGELKPVA